MASFTRAHSVGSPTASSESGSSSASEHRAIAVSRRRSSSPRCSTTVILFCVSVPVLSEQIIWVHPRVSTAVSFRMMAFLFDMLVTPMDSTMVTTAANPSGIAATAKDTATMKVLRSVSPVIPSGPNCARNSPTAKMTIQIPITSTVRILLSWLSFIWRGVSSLWAWESASAIFPISVFMPVPVITALPRPYTTVEPIYIMFLRSPRGTSFSPPRFNTLIILLTGTDSPVRAASSIFMLALSMIRPSAGTESPASSTTISPGTSSSLFKVTIFPSRITLLVAAAISCRAAMAASALLSCTTPSTALIITTAIIIITSVKDSPS